MRTACPGRRFRPGRLHGSRRLHGDDHPGLYPRPGTAGRGGPGRGGKAEPTDGYRPTGRGDGRLVARRRDPATGLIGPRLAVGGGRRRAGGSRDTRAGRIGAVARAGGNRPHRG
ncbi:hypothetical protein CcI156_19550 [Frankia sp. CcI156]|nr:hypothetical protein CcI156_19550 [Frankia sp. CcI156]ORT95238.1 hypothetical protein UK99_13700 [Frankia casuarinae]